MATTVITPEDLELFKTDLIASIKDILSQTESNQSDHKWMKSNDVRKFLGISPGTLQNLRVNGTLPYSKIGGVIFYDQNDIKRMLEENRIDNSLE